MFTALTLFALVLTAPPVNPEEEAVKEMLHGRIDALNRRDAKWLADHFVDDGEDGEHVDASGNRTIGRANITKAYQAVFDSPVYKDVEWKGEVERIKFITPDVAMVDATWDQSGHDAKGVAAHRSGKSLLILRKTDEGWEIVSSRASPKPAKAAK